MNEGDQRSNRKFGTKNWKNRELEAIKKMRQESNCFARIISLVRATSGLFVIA